MKRLFITIDTEMDADIHWKKKKPIQFSSVLEGIPLFLRPIWDKYGVCPIYFVSPEVLYNDDCCNVLIREISKGAIIGAHLHPEYIEPDMGEIGSIETESFPCYKYDYATEKQKIFNLKKLIKEKLAYDVVWYRAARFGADDETIKILDELGFKYDSSYTPYIDWSNKGGPNHSKTSLNAYYFDNLCIKEIPVTIYGKRFGIFGKFLPNNWLFYRWLRPTHMTLFEEKCLIRNLKELNIENIVMMFHSMEIMENKTPYVRNRVMQKYYLWRLEQTIKFAIANGYVSYKAEDE